MSKLLAVTIDLEQEARSQGVIKGDGSFGGFVSGILSGVMVLALIIVLFYFVWGAIEWITAGGEKGAVEKARNKITGAITGIIVLAAVLALFTLVQQFIGVEIIRFR